MLGWLLDVLRVVGPPSNMLCGWVSTYNFFYGNLKDEADSNKGAYLLCILYTESLESST